MRYGCRLADMSEFPSSSAIPRPPLPPRSPLPNDPRLTPWTPRGGRHVTNFGPPAQFSPFGGIQPAGAVSPHGVSPRFPPPGMVVPFPHHPFSPRQLSPAHHPALRPPSMGHPGPYFHLPPHHHIPQASLLQTPPPPPLGGVGGIFPGSGPGTLLSPPPPPPRAPDPTDLFLRQWVADVTAGHRERQTGVHEDRPMKIPEARGLLSHALGLLSSMTECHRQLTELTDLGERGERGGQQWTTVMAQVQNWQKELLDIRELVDRGDNVQRLGRKLASIKKRRVKVKEGVKRRRREREEERERSERRAEQWLQKKRQEKLKKETERSVQSDASGLLGEVKRKQNDIQHYSKLLASLKQLRELKREAHRKTGEPLVKEDEVFAAECERLSGILQERAKLYQEEEHALRVMVQEEVEERMLAESSAVEARGKAQEGEEGGEDREGGVYPVDPLQSFADYYLQAERSVEALLHIRRNWDMYLSVEGTPLPSQLPQLTAPPPSGQWTDYYNTQNAT